MARAVTNAMFGCDTYPQAGGTLRKRTGYLPRLAYGIGGRWSAPSRGAGAGNRQVDGIDPGRIRENRCRWRADYHAGPSVLSGTVERDLRSARRSLHSRQCRPSVAALIGYGGNATSDALR